MPTIGVRVSKELYDKLEKSAKAHSTNKSDLIRMMIDDNLQLNPTEDWEVQAWNLFSISADQFKYAMRNARTAEEFFSSIGKWAKNLELKVFRTEDSMGISTNFNGTMLTITKPRTMTKIETISSIIKDLDTLINASILDLGSDIEASQKVFMEQQKTEKG